MLNALKDTFFNDFNFLLGKARDLDDTILSSYDLSKIHVIVEKPPALFPKLQWSPPLQPWPTD